MAVLATEIAASPDASSSPDAGNGNDDDNKKDYPLVMGREPGTVTRIRFDGELVEVAVPVAVAVVVASPMFAQNPVYQAWMLPRSPAAVQALSHTPAVPVEKAVSRASLQKQES